MEATTTTAGDGKVKLGGAKTPRKAKELLPEQDYLFEITWCEKTFAQNGKPRLSFRLKVAAGPSVGKRAFEDCYLTEEALWKLENLAFLCGIPKDTEIDPNNPKSLVETFVGKSFHGYIKHEEYQTNDGQAAKAQRVGWYVPKEQEKPKPDAVADDAKSAKADDVPF